MISADATTLVLQASHTAHDYFRMAVKTIDSEFGEGYAAKHPDLIASLVNVACKDFSVAITLKEIAEMVEDVKSVITDTLEEINEYRSNC